MDELEKNLNNEALPKKPDAAFFDDHIRYSPYQTPCTPPAASVKKKAEHNRFFTWKSILAFAIILTILFGSIGVTVSYLNHRWESKMAALEQEHQAELADLESKINQSGGGYGIAAPTGNLTPSQVYAMNIASVVSVSCEVVTNGYFGSSVGVSSGSGFIISADGYILTNAHVVNKASAIEIQTHGGETYTATLVGADTINDVALLKVEATELPFVTLGSSSTLAVGDQVAAIGNALGTLSSTMTVGFVSAKDRVVDTDGSVLNMIQTDAAINSGNSGGPLFNMNGEVVGITTAKYSGKTSSGSAIEGVSFAIPIDDVAGMIRDLVDKGYVSGAYLGVVVEDVSSEDVRRYGLPQGALVTEVSAGFAAERAGMLSRDIIVELGGKQVDSISTLTRVLRGFKPGDEVDVTVYRGGKEVDLKIVLDEKPKQTESVPQQTQPEDNTSQSPFDGYDNFLWPFFG